MLTNYTYWDKPRLELAPANQMLNYLIKNSHFNFFRYPALGTTRRTYQSTYNSPGMTIMASTVNIMRFLLQAELADPSAEAATTTFRPALFSLELHTMSQVLSDYHFLLLER